MKTVLKVNQFWRLIVQRNDHKLINKLGSIGYIHQTYIRNQPDFRHEEQWKLSTMDTEE